MKEIRSGPDGLIRRFEAARLLGISVNTVDALVARGTLPRPLKLSRRVTGWRVSEWDKALERLAAASR